MSQDAPTPPDRTRVEFTPDSIARRQALSRAFRTFALCATFFGLAMLVIFLGRLTYDVVAWFRIMPTRVHEQNVRLEAFRQRLAEPDTLRTAKLQAMRNEMDAELRAAPDDATRTRLRQEWETELIPAEQKNDEIAFAEQRREIESGYRSDLSAGAIFGHFMTAGPAPEGSPQDAGILYGLLGTLWLVGITLAIALPVGVGAAIYLEEYSSSSRMAQLIQININNLAGVPSVMFGILGAFVFVEMIFRPIELEMERPARIAEYQERYDRLRELKRIPDEDTDTAGLIRRVVDPTGSLDAIDRGYAKLVEAGKAPAVPRTETDRVLAVLDPDGRLAPYLAKFEVLVREHTIDKLVEAKKLKSPARSPLDVPEQVLIAEGKSADAIKKELAWLEPIREADAKVNRIAQDQHRLTAPNYLIQGFASAFRTLGVSLAARNVLGGGLTLALLILPVLIVASQEAIRAVPVSLRHGALALGATRWQTIWRIVLPSAAPGILTGTILAICRAMGEAAPLVLFGATLYVDQLPTLFSRFTVMPMQIFVWSDRVSEDWRLNAALASFILLILLLALNGLAIYLRQRSQAQTRY